MNKTRRRKRMGTDRYFHANVTTVLPADSDQRAEELARQGAEVINHLGGRVDVVRQYGDAAAILACTFPDWATVGVDLLDKFFGLSFREVHAFVVASVQDQGITFDD